MSASGGSVVVFAGVGEGVLADSGGGTPCGLIDGHSKSKKARRAAVTKPVHSGQAGRAFRGGGSPRISCRRRVSVSTSWSQRESVSSHAWRWLSGARSGGSSRLVGICAPSTSTGMTCTSGCSSARETSRRTRSSGLSSRRFPSASVIDVRSLADDARAPRRRRATTRHAGGNPTPPSYRDVPEQVARPKLLLELVVQTSGSAARVGAPVTDEDPVSAHMAPITVAALGASAPVGAPSRRGCARGDRSETHGRAGGSVGTHEHQRRSAVALDRAGRSGAAEPPLRHRTTPPTSSCAPPSGDGPRRSDRDPVSALVLRVIPDPPCSGDGQEPAGAVVDQPPALMVTVGAR